MDIRKFVQIVEPPPPRALSSQSLLDRHRPARSGDVIASEMTYLCAKQWIARFRARDPSIKKMMLLSGASGVGKSLLARLLLEEAGYNVVIIDVKNKAGIVSLLRELHPGTNAILLDDVDALLDASSPVVSEIVQYVNPLKGRRNATNKDRLAYSQEHWVAPVVATCKVHTHGRTVDFAKQCEIVGFGRPSKARMEQLLLRIAEKEKMPLTPENARKIIETSKRDIRNAIMILDASRGRVVVEGGVSAKDHDIDAIAAITALTKSARPMPCKTAFRLAQADTSVVPLMMFENYTDICKMHGSSAIGRAAAAADAMSTANTIEERMYATGNFDMFDVYNTFAVVAPAAAICTTSTHDIRFGNMWSKISNMHVKMSSFRNLRDAFPALWTISDVMGRYEYVSLLRKTCDACIVAGSMAELARACARPEHLVQICRFGMRAAVVSSATLQTLQKKLTRELLAEKK